MVIWWITSPKSSCQSYWLKVISTCYQFEAIYIYIVSFSIRTLSHAFSQHSLWPTQNGRFNNHLKYSPFIMSWMKLAIVWFLNWQLGEITHHSQYMTTSYRLWLPFFFFGPSLLLYSSSSYKHSLCQSILTILLTTLRTLLVSCILNHHWDNYYKSFFFFFFFLKSLPRNFFLYIKRPN